MWVGTAWVDGVGGHVPCPHDLDAGRLIRGLLAGGQVHLIVQLSLAVEHVEAQLGTGHGEILTCCCGRRKGGGGGVGLIW